MKTLNINALVPFTALPPRENIGRQLTTSHRYPVLYQQITKCGCTYLHAVLRHLDGKPPGFAEDLQAEHLSDEAVKNTAAKIIVVRNPIDRFTSLYFDKCIGKTNKIQGAMVRRGIIDLNAGNSLELHQENCMRLLNHIRKSMSGDNKVRQNWHWRPQVFRVKQVLPYNFDVITLEGLLWQLPLVIGDTVPNIEQALYEVPLQNVSEKPIDPDDLMVQELENEVLELYPTDFQIHEEVSAFWDRKKQDLGQNGAS